jgi:hypothetical protein
MKKFKNHIEEEVFNHHIVQGSTEKGKVTHTGTLRQMQKTIRDPKTPTDHVLVKTRHDLKTGDSWKKHMHAEDTADDLLKKKKKIAQTISHPGYDMESKNEEFSEAAFWQIKIPGIPNPIFIESSSKSSIRKDLRSQLKPDVWKDVTVERITKPNMVKMYRRLAKEGPPSEEEEVTEIIAPLVGLGARFLAKKAVGAIAGKAAGTLAPAVAGGVAAGTAHAATKHVLKKKKEKEANEEKREPIIRIEDIDSA